MKFTVFGSSGFVGRHVTAHLCSRGHDVLTPERGALLTSEGLGHVIYCIGVVGGVPDAEAAMVEAHAVKLWRLLNESSYDSFLYVSSTRLYALSECTAEDTAVSIRPSGRAVFDASKLLGESLCLALDRPSVRIARLSNAYGDGMNSEVFLASVLRDLHRHGEVVMGESPASSKDYVSVGDVAELFERIAVNGKERIYNVASGHVTTHGQIAQALSGLGRVRFADGGGTRCFPPIDTSRIEAEFGMKQRDFLTDGLVSLMRSVERPAR